uniref:Putative secreted peptide n=1 Tax=Anopheles braziliensis TaxID=58242 RepID=A0A2M3ZWW1_9DIPT
MQQTVLVSGLCLGPCTVGRSLPSIRTTSQRWTKSHETKVPSPSSLPMYGSGDRGHPVACAACGPEHIEREK